MSDYTRGTGQCPHGADAGGCPVLGCANHVQRLSSPPPPVPEVDVEAVVRQLHGMTCASAAFAGVCDGEQCDIEGAIMIGVQAGLDARGAEVERLGEQLRLANIDALNESATNAHLQERVGLLELGDKALQDRLAALEDLELSVETLELNESKRADAAEAQLACLPEIEAALEAAERALLELAVAMGDPRPEKAVTLRQVRSALSSLRSKRKGEGT